MKLSTAILLVGALAFAILLFAQFRWTEAAAATFERKRAWTLIGALALFGLLASAHLLAVEAETPPPDPTYITTEGPEESYQPPPNPPPPPPPPPVARQQDCPPGTTLAAGLCRRPAEAE